VQRSVIIALATVYLVWSSTYYALRVAVEALPVLLMGGTRYLIAGVILFTVAKLRGGPWPTVQHWLWALLPGGFLFLVGNGFVALAEVRLSSGVAAVVAGTAPLFAAMIAPLFKEKTRQAEWLGMGLGFTGIVVLFMSAELRAEAASSVLLALAPLGWAVGSMIARKVPVAPGMLAPATQMIAGGVLLLIAGLARQEQVPPELPLRAVAAVVYLIAAGSLAGFTAYSYLLKATRPALAMSYSYVNPPIAVLIGVALGKEQVGPEMIGAVALIVAGTYALLRAART
jgi:drug/metabolite transporter (DMT)-like permease